MSPRARKSARLVERIRVLHAESDSVLGAPRLWDDLREEGETCSLNRVARLMRVNEIQGIPCKRSIAASLPARDLPMLKTVRLETLKQTSRIQNG